MRKGGLEPVRAFSKRAQRIERKVTVKDVVEKLVCIGLGRAVWVHGTEGVDFLQ